ncbi:hypothetical protein Tco_0530240 [Tanacetum coccineum]
MANSSSYRSDVLSEVPHSDNTHDNMLNQSVQEMSYSEHSHIMDYPETIQNIDSSAQQDAMILSVYEQLSNQVTNYNKVNKDTMLSNESLTIELERYKERIKQFEQRQNINLSEREKLIDSQMDDMIRDRNEKFASFQTEIETLKHDLSKHIKEKEYLSNK